LLHSLDDNLAMPTENDVIDLCSDEEDFKSSTALLKCANESDQENVGCNAHRKRKTEPTTQGLPRDSADIDSDTRKTVRRETKGCTPSSLLMFLDGEGMDNGDVTEGLMPELRKIPHLLTCAGRAGKQSLMPHIQQRDKWSCGFRNLQMMLGSVLSLLSSTHSYFQQESTTQTRDDGYLCIPSVMKLQRTIEQCWTNGFDAKGASHYKHSIVGSSAQIGAMEVSHCLTFVGIDNVVIQFMACQESRSQMTPFCTAYFSKAYASACPYCNSGISPRDSRAIAKQLLETVSSGSVSLVTAPCQCPTLPLYLQWKGHSVSIVGVESQSGRYDSIKHLLVLDPSLSGSSLKKALLQGDIKPLRFAVAKLEKKDCQIILPTTLSLSFEEKKLRKAEYALTAAHKAVQAALLNQYSNAKEQRK
jgi:Peptidase family C78